MQRLERLKVRKRLLSFSISRELQRSNCWRVILLGSGMLLGSTTNLEKGFCDIVAYMNKININLIDINRKQDAHRSALMLFFFMRLIVGVLRPFCHSSRFYRSLHFYSTFAIRSSKARLFPNFLIVLFSWVLLKLFLFYFLFLNNFCQDLSSLSYRKLICPRSSAIFHIFFCRTSCSRWISRISMSVCRQMSPFYLSLNILPFLMCSSVLLISFMKIWENSSSSQLLILFRKDCFQLLRKFWDLLSQCERSFLLAFLQLSSLMTDDFCLCERSRVDFCLEMCSSSDLDCGFAFICLRFIFRSQLLLSRSTLLLTLLVLFSEETGFCVFWERISALVLEALSSGTLDKLSFWNRFFRFSSRSMFRTYPSFSPE